MRTGQNEMQAGVIKNGYSYEHQCWIENFIVLHCGHLANMPCGCFGKAHQGEQVRFSH